MNFHVCLLVRLQIHRSFLVDFIHRFYPATPIHYHPLQQNTKTHPPLQAPNTPPQHTNAKAHVRCENEGKEPITNQEGRLQGGPRLILGDLAVAGTWRSERWERCKPRSCQPFFTVHAHFAGHLQRRLCFLVKH